jgi:hypothetical protein
LDIALRAFGAGVIGEDRFAETGGFGEFDASGDDGAENVVLEEVAEIGGDLTGQVSTVVVHREEYALYLKGVTKGVADAVDGVHEFGDAFEGEELTLDRDDGGVGSYEGIEGEEVERGRAVDEDEVKIAADGGDAFSEAVFALGEADKFEIGPCEVFIGGDQGEAFEGGWDDDIFGGSFSEEEVVNAWALETFGNAQAAGSVALGVAVDDQDAKFTGG